MKKHGFRIAMIASLLMLVFSPLVPSPRAEPADQACSNRTLRGDYGFTVEAQFPGPVALRGVGMAHFDGAGNFTQVDHVVVNGMPPGPPQWHPGFGTYSLNPDCTGTTTVSFADGRPSARNSLVVVRQGAEWHLVVDTTPPAPGEYIIVTGIKRDEP
jgi:hypothetical protein